MTHIHPEQSFPLGAGVVALVGWGSDYKAPWLVPQGLCGDREDSGPVVSQKEQQEQGTLWRMSWGRASLCTVLLSYLSDLWELVALIKSDVYWVWNVLIC